MNARQRQLEQAQRHCEQVTRAAAANFYYGIRLLSADKRRAMCAVYAYARRIDDIGDGKLDAAHKLARLQAQRTAVLSLASPGGDLEMIALADASRRFDLSVEDLCDLIDGVVMDIHGERYETIDELVVYCRRVAGSIGRLCLSIFGSRERERARGLADDLGVAMQLTNILRDVREDAANGRVYVPAEDLARAGLPNDHDSALAAFTGPPNAELVALVRLEAARSRGWFYRGLGLVQLLDRRSAACVMAMTGIYRQLLERIEADPQAVLRTRVSLPTHEKIWVASRSLAAAARSPARPPATVDNDFKGRGRAAPGARVVVVGGGLAGITAALDCADAGAQVTLLEVRPRLGGAAYSFEREGMLLDNGQHVFLRCCSAYRGLLARLGSEHAVLLQPRLEIPVLSPGRKPYTLRRNSLPAPFHLAAALARYPHLTAAGRAGAVRAALALARIDPDDPANDRVTFGEWLARHGQDQAAIDALWDLIALPTLNLRAQQASLALGAFVFRTGLLGDNAAGDIGFHRLPLSEVIGEPAARALAAAGVSVRTSWRAEQVLAEDGDLRVEGAADAVPADAVIVALPHGRAAGVLPEQALAGASWPQALHDAPIVNLHVVYDRRVCDYAFAAGVGTPVQYVFDRSNALEGAGQYLAVSLSGAFEEMAMSVASLRELYLPALSALFPAARAAQVQRFLVTREHAATFRAEPGTASVRPSARTAQPGILLAGSWTATGGPGTLEGAVLSGHAAAEAALQYLQARRRSAVPG